LLLLQATTVHRALLPLRLQRLPLQALADNLSLLPTARFDVRTSLIRRKADFTGSYPTCKYAISVAHDLQSTLAHNPNVYLWIVSHNGGEAKYQTD
jgi:hypothetical protein